MKAPEIITDKRVPEALALFSSVARESFTNQVAVSDLTTLESVPGVSGTVSTCLVAVGPGRTGVFCLVNIATPAVSTDHPALLEYAARRARARGCPFFITCTLKGTALWGTPTKGISVSRNHQIKNYFDIFQIDVNPNLPLDEQAKVALKERAREILSDLWRLHRDGRLELVDIEADFFVHRLVDAATRLSAPIKRSLALTLERDPKFREKIVDWAVLQGIPADVKSDEFAESVSRQIVYRLLGKIIFYQSLRRSAWQLPELDLSGIDSSQVLPTLRRCFAKALEVDYHAVFREDIVDTILFPREASLELADLVTDLNTRDFASLPQDVVGEVFERLIPPDERHTLGQYFTREDLVDIIVAFCVRSADDIILDPTCGTGTFLIRSYDRLIHLGRLDHSQLLQQLWGVDVAPFPAELATINLFRQRLAEHRNFPRILCEDFLRVQPGSSFKFPPPKATVDNPEFVDETIPQFDAIVGNFPYISQDRIEKRVKGYRDFLRQTLIEDWLEDYPQLFVYPSKKLQEEFEHLVTRGEHKRCNREGLQHRISTYADIYAYLFFHAARFLKPGGRMGIVTSNAWIDANFGYVLQKFFLDRFKIIAIPESRCEPWFDVSSVNTIVTVVERCDDSKERDNHIVKFIKVKRRLRDLVPENLKTEAANRWTNLQRLVGRVEAASARAPANLVGHETVEDDDFRIRLRRQGEMRKEIETAGATVKWGKYLRAPEIAFKLIESAKSGLCLLGGLAGIKRGCRTSINQFFYMTSAQAAERGIAKEYLIPLLRSPKNTGTILIRPKECDMMVFVCRDDKNGIREKGHKRTLEYIEWGERQTYSRGSFMGLRWPEGTEVSRRRPGWWALPQNQTQEAQVFFSCAYGDRHIQRFSPAPLVPDNRLYFLGPTDGIKAEELAAVTNCSLTSLLVEVCGRVSMGDGALELTVEDARDYLVVPKIQEFAAKDRQAIVKAFRKLLDRPIASIPAELEKPDRQELDKAVLKAIGLPLKMLEDIYDGLRTLVHERVQLGKMRSKAKRSRPARALERVSQDVIDDLLPNGPRRFPDDFLTPSAKRGPFVEHEIPVGKLEAHLTPLFSHITGDAGFSLQLKTPFEAKFLLYAHRSGHTKVRMPEAAVEISRAVKNYEIYLRELKEAFYTAYYKRTLDQQAATRLTAQAFDTLGVPIPPEGD